MKYSSEHLMKAKAEGLPLFKIEVDFRFAKPVGKGMRVIQNWGACDVKTALKLKRIIRQEK